MDAFCLSKQISNLGEEFDIEVIARKRSIADCGHCERRTDGQTPMEEALRLHECHSILCAESERNYVPICLLCGLESLAARVGAGPSASPHWI